MSKPNLLDAMPQVESRAKKHSQGGDTVWMLGAGSADELDLGRAVQGGQTTGEEGTHDVS